MHDKNKNNIYNSKISNMYIFLYHAYVFLKFIDIKSNLNITIIISSYAIIIKSLYIYIFTNILLFIFTPNIFLSSPFCVVPLLAFSIFVITSINRNRRTAYYSVFSFSLLFKVNPSKYIFIY